MKVTGDATRVLTPFSKRVTNSGVCKSSEVLVKNIPTNVTVPEVFHAVSNEVFLDSTPDPREEENRAPQGYIVIHETVDLVFTSKNEVANSDNSVLSKRSLCSKIVILFIQEGPIKVT